VAIAAGGGEPLFGGESGITLASRLEWFVAAALAEHNDWSRYWWVDGFFCSLRVLDTVTVEAAGTLLWVDGAGTYRDPAWARIRLSKTLPQLEEYEVRFGDRSVGMRSVSYTQEPPMDWPEVMAWELTIRGAGYPAPT
jgi:hypothetical protein